jgi:epoxide hydrolase-like predicted phosphatase
MSGAHAVVSDFGGVLTSPLSDAFARIQEEGGVPLDALGRAMAATARASGEPPLFALERGELSEAEFLAGLEAALADDLGRPVSLDGFAERYFSALRPNEELFAFLRGARDRGVALALCTNNVREWEPRWRTMLPIDEIFAVVVDSAFVGARKPERAIYEVTLDRLGTAPGDTVFLDDVEVNVAAARELGLRAIHFEDTGQAIAALEAELAG